MPSVNATCYCNAVLHCIIVLCLKAAYSFWIGCQCTKNGQENISCSICFDVAHHNICHNMLWWATTFTLKLPCLSALGAIQNKKHYNMLLHINMCCCNVPNNMHIATAQRQSVIWALKIFFNLFTGSSSILSLIPYMFPHAYAHCLCIFTYVPCLCIFPYVPFASKP